MASIHQQNVVDYHAAIAQGHHGHGGHNMHQIHRKWHVEHPDPKVPTGKNSNWGTNLPFGTHFLQMHHEMVSAGEAEPKSHMQHASIVAWYQATGRALPPVWQAGTPIPAELGYAPDLAAFPADIQAAISAAAKKEGQKPEAWLTRKTNHPTLQLPKYFTVAGISAGEAAEPVTGARKLADFKNVNQLGCCIVRPHNTWHGDIGGAMRSTLTAIADPIFYFGVHWHIDQVYLEYLQIQAAAPHLMAETEASDSLAEAVSAQPFSAAEMALLEKWKEDSAALHAAL